MKDINLLLEEEKRIPEGEISAARPAKVAGKIILAIFIIAIAAATIVLPIVYNEVLDLRLTSIKEQLKDEKYQEAVSVKSQLAAAEQLLEGKKSIIEHIDEQAYPVDNILNAVRNNIPEGCEVNSIQYDKSSLQLGIKAIEITNIAEFLLNMDRLSSIRLSESSNTIRINTSGEYVLNFDIVRNAVQKEGE